MKHLFAAVLLFASLQMFACKDPYGTVITASSVAAQSISQGMQTVDSLRQQNVITVGEESKALDYFEFANKADGAVLTCAQAAHTNGSKAPGTYTQCLTAFNSALNNPEELALIRVSNTSASKTISDIVNGIVAGVNSVVAGLGGS